MLVFLLFFFNDTATTAIYTLSLHDALPISVLDQQQLSGMHPEHVRLVVAAFLIDHHRLFRDRKSTRLNSSHRTISYAVFCLKKKKKFNVTFKYLMSSVHYPCLLSIAMS